MKIKIEQFEKEVSADEISQSVFEIDFDGALKVQIEKQGDAHFVVNAMNGWGDNCLNEYTDSKVEILNS